MKKIENSMEKFSFKNRNNDFDKLMEKSHHLSKLIDKDKFEKYYSNCTKKNDINLFKLINDDGIRQRNRFKSEWGKIYKRVKNKDILNKSLHEIIPPKTIINYGIGELDPSSETRFLVDIVKLWSKSYENEDERMLRNRIYIPNEPSFKNLNMFDTDKSLLNLRIKNKT